MEVTVLYFASLQDAVGTRQNTAALPAGATVGDCVALLSERAPALAARLPRSRVAVNGEFADSARVLADGDEVALLPPMSGG
jgi:molybdopterin converting factor subunit 1